MGRIRTKFIKRTADKLISTFKGSFETDFNKNKLQVAKLTDVSTKKLRNQIAGFITKKLKTAE